MFDENEDSVPEMPFFEASNADDRPIAPDADEYPVGCEVELRDVEFSKKAQEMDKWEPFMDNVFAIPRRRAIVCRHMGEYTYIRCDDVEGYDTVCFTLYRACLSEPKVKTTKFYAETATKVGREQPQLSIHSLTKLGSIGEAKELLKSKTKVDRGEKETYIAKMKMGTAKFGKKDYQQAMKYYNEAVELADDEDKWRPLGSRSAAYLALRNFEEAKKDALDVMQLSPTQYHGYVRYANVLRCQGKDDDAMQYFRQALELAPADVKPSVQAMLLSNYARVFYKKNTIKEIRMHFVEEKSKMEMQTVMMCRMNDLVFRESTQLASVVTSNFYGNPRRSDSIPSTMCACCGKVSASNSAILTRFPSIRDGLMRSLTKKIRPVPCKDGCGRMYCSERCRSEAFQDHHWAECPKTGIRREVMKEVHDYIDAYIGNNTASFAESCYERYCDAKGSMCLELDTSRAAVGTCARVAIRMIFRMLNGSKTIEDAVNLYIFLPISDAVRTQVMQSEVKFFLEETYKKLALFIGKEQSNYINYAKFEECYAKAKTNAVLLSVSVWPNIRELARANLGILSNPKSANSSKISDAFRNDPAGILLDAPAPIIDKSNLADVELLNKIIELPHSTLVKDGYNVVCLFERSWMVSKHNFLNKESFCVNTRVNSLFVSKTQIYFAATTDIPVNSVLMCEY